MKNGIRVRCMPFLSAPVFSRALRFHSSVMSASSMPVTKAEFFCDRRRFLAMAFLTPFIGTLSIKPCLSFVSFFTDCATERTSSSVVRPPAPVPLILSRSIPSFFARFLTMGVASTSSSIGRLPTTERDFLAPVSTASPSISITRSVCPTFTVSPSAALRLTTLPFFGDGTSTIALSVSTSTTT